MEVNATQLKNDRTEELILEIATQLKNDRTEELILEIQLIWAILGDSDMTGTRVVYCALSTYRDILKSLLIDEDLFLSPSSPPLWPGEM